VRPADTSPPLGPPPRPPQRRDQILSAATDLFREHGFRGIGINEIGAAAGVTGPAVYRHFANKHALLVTILDEVTTRLLDAATLIAANAGDAPTALARLVDYHVDFAIGERSIIAVYVQEQRNLPPDDRRRVRRRQREYLGVWVGQLRVADPSLDESEALTVVQAAIGAIASIVSYEPRIPASRLHDVLVARTLALLGTPVGTSGRS
jgi:AcrR family transcriptional regulator